MIGDAVAFDHRNEMLGPVARQRRSAEMRIVRKKVLGPCAGIGEIAATTARHQDLLTAAVGVLNHPHPSTALTRRQRAEQSCRATADHQYIERITLSHAWRPAERWALH